MAFKDRDEFLDSLYDHIFPEKDFPDGVDEDDENFFEHVASFFKESDDQGSGGSGSGSGGGTNAPRRRRTQSQSGTPRRRRRQSSNSGSTGYGNRTFFGTS
jgi:hypothetical protein